MKLNDIIFFIEINTKIKAFVDNKEIGILYISPLSRALFKKRYYDITNINVNNNKLILYLTSNNEQANTTNRVDITLFDILPLIKNKDSLKIFYTDTEVILNQKYLNNAINKIFINDNILNIILK